MEAAPERQQAALSPLSGRRRLFPFAGLWERNDQLEVTNCTIIIAEPNAVAAEIHDRMPVILSEADYDAWLAAEAAPEAPLALLRPYEGEMIAYPVSKAVGSPKNDSPELVELVEESG